MKLYDLTHPFTIHTPGWVGYPSPKLSYFQRFATHGIVSQLLELPLHSGTHFDAEMHIVSGGADLASIPIERLCRDAGVRRFLVDLREGKWPALRSELSHARLERAIGVIYRPETELASHYFDAHLPQQFDGYVWFEETQAIKPLPAQMKEGAPETYPFGL